MFLYTFKVDAPRQPKQSRNALLNNNYFIKIKKFQLTFQFDRLFTCNARFVKSNSPKKCFLSNSSEIFKTHPHIITTRCIIFSAVR